MAYKQPSSPNITCIKRKIILEQLPIPTNTTIKPFWNTLSSHVSKQLWSPTIHNCSLSETSFYRHYQSKKLVISPSWELSDDFEPTSKQKHILEETDVPLETSDLGFVESIEGNIVTRKIPFFPNEPQKKFFKKCFKAHRYIYNATVAHINTTYEDRIKDFTESLTCILCNEPKDGETFTCIEHKHEQLPWNFQFSFITLRNLIVKNNSQLEKDQEWLSEIPADTRQLAVKDAVTAYKAAMTNKQRGHIQHFKLGFKSRKTETQMFWVDPRAIKRVNNIFILCSKSLGKDSQLKIPKSQFFKIPTKINNAFKIMKIKGMYYIVISYKEQFKAKTETPNKIIALDPGVRTFLTGYSPSGSVIKIGENQQNQIVKYQEKLDNYRSILSKATNCRKRKNCKKRCMKIEHKIRNITENLHNQTSSYLCKNYENILLPEFGTSKMQTSHVLGSSTKRMMNALSHYRFQQKILGMCEKHHKKLYIVDESYTTQTCGGCGICHKVGGSRIYKCSKCQYEQDRDVHGARNILIKTWIEHIKN